LAGAVAVPIEPIPGLDVLYDLAVSVALIGYWFTFFRSALKSPPAVPAQARDCERISAQSRLR
jgi:hypothetical protein